MLSKLGILPAKIKQFNRKGIYSVDDLINYFPRRYNNYSVLTGILPPEYESVLIVKVKDVKQYDSKTPMIMVKGIESFSKSRINICWFNQNFLYNKLYNMINREIFVVGKVTYNKEYWSYNMSGPVFFTSDVVNGPRIYPVYSKITGMSDEYLFGKIKEAVSIDYFLKETCPDYIIKSEKLMRKKEAINELHFPNNIDRLKEAQRRIVFDDLLYYALKMEYADRKVSKGSIYNIRTLKKMTQILNGLPFTLTEDQQKALDSMIDCAREGKRINALVQGDVSCGKTIVALLMMIAMADSGYQAAIMAPTQVLARQHYEELCRLVEPIGLNVAFFGGQAMKKKERNALLAKLKDGSVDLVVGTHSLISKDVEFNKLALVITDEEHKFGVLQRAALTEKAASGVHSISMSATPIPRSLAQVIYGGGIQLHTIKSMPKGRMPVKTSISNSYSGTFKFLYSELEKGRQVYVVCPMIDKNEDMENLKSVEEISEMYKDEFETNGYRVGTLTGRNSKEETDEIIEKFKKKELDILVSTTVIEVGVNVPNASVIVIQNAERFGLSGLHQLRGRVGRGSAQSYCILFSDDKENERLNAMVATTDGFKIAEADLKLRGAGELIGTKQSGDDKFMGLMLSNLEWYDRIKQIAADLLDSGEDCGILEKIYKEEENTEEVDENEF